VSRRSEGWMPRHRPRGRGGGADGAEDPAGHQTLGQGCGPSVRAKATQASSTSQALVAPVVGRPHRAGRPVSSAEPARTRVDRRRTRSSASSLLAVGSRRSRRVDDERRVDLDVGNVDRRADPALRRGRQGRTWTHDPAGPPNGARGRSSTARHRPRSRRDGPWVGATTTRAAAAGPAGRVGPGVRRTAGDGARSHVDPWGCLPTTPLTKTSMPRWSA
jgi:hypothetical protein